eukprot:TRINITY_DN81646_c0_g1_i1.p1 TRINITY_DN81646_c0_g1~~TRINITY_DN81646_c0_g1_i1.p1  ORF type:complete len:261 (+),score=34.60 TRINITY_DN81646_c0_g1_i1:178-960(+)
MSFPHLCVGICNCCCKSFCILPPSCLCPICNVEFAVRKSHESGLGCAHPMSVVVRSTKGSLSTTRYDPNALLHVGLSDSSCRVYNFLNFYRIDSPWESCLSIRLKIEMDCDAWDALLASDIEMRRAALPTHPYHQIFHNCFDYVVEVLNGIGYLGRHIDKIEFADEFIMPRMQQLEEFVLLRNLVARRGFVRIPLPPAVCDNCGCKLETGNWFRCSVCVDFDFCRPCFEAKGSEHPHHMIEVPRNDDGDGSFDDSFDKMS